MDCKVRNLFFIKRYDVPKMFFLVDIFAWACFDHEPNVDLSKHAQLPITHFHSLFFLIIHKNTIYTYIFLGVFI